MAAPPLLRRLPILRPRRQNGPCRECPHWLPSTLSTQSTSRCHPNPRAAKTANDDHPDSDPPHHVVVSSPNNSHAASPTETTTTTTTMIWGATMATITCTIPSNPRPAPPSNPPRRKRAAEKASTKEAATPDPRTGRRQHPNDTKNTIAAYRRRGKYPRSRRFCAWRSMRTEPNPTFAKYWNSTNSSPSKTHLREKTTPRGLRAMSF
mmetsp:Transcript_22609/g.47683  ORF Transcript_22609/g.47683 Transcript_22609/m.47683 type:complete len:207 (+) Transcript_22609:1094-1714(+)